MVRRLSNFKENFCFVKIQSYLVKVNKEKKGEIDALTSCKEQEFPLNRYFQ